MKGVAGVGFYGRMIKSFTRFGMTDKQRFAGADTLPKDATWEISWKHCLSFRNGESRSRREARFQRKRPRRGFGNGSRIRISDEGGHMTTADAARQILGQMPDEAPMDEIMYAMYVNTKLRRGQKEIDEGKWVSHEEAMQRLRKWLR